MEETKDSLMQATTNEEVQAQEGLSVEKGILLFHDSEGNLRFNQINEVSLENITYYLRYLERIEAALWEEKMGGAQNA